MVLENDRFPPLPQRQPQSIVRGQLISEPPSQFISRFVRAFASITITITGSISNNDQLQVNVTLPAIGTISKTITATGSDTTTTLAQKIAKALSDDSTLRAYRTYANSLANVVTFNWPGPLGNFVTLTQSVPVGSESIALGNSGAMAGGAGPILPYNTFEFNIKGQVIDCRANTPMNVGTNVVAAMAAASAAIE